MSIVLTWVAALLGVPTAIATTIVKVILGAGTLITVLGMIATIASGGATTLMTMGWAAFKETVKKLARQSMVKAIAW